MQFSHSISRRQTFMTAFLLSAIIDACIVSPSYAGCLCNALSSYIKCGGTILFFAYFSTAVLLSRKSNWRAAKKTVLAAAILLTISMAMADALNSDLWYTPGVIANSEAWLNGGVPAHWISLLIIGSIYSFLFVVCSLLPTIIAFRKRINDKAAVLRSNIVILLIPGAFVMAPFLFFDLASQSVMMFWSAVFTNPKAIPEIPAALIGSIALWSVFLGLFAVFWSTLFFDVINREEQIDQNDLAFSQ